MPLSFNPQYAKRNINEWILPDSLLAKYNGPLHDEIRPVEWPTERKYILFCPKSFIIWFAELHNQFHHYDEC